MKQSKAKRAAALVKLARELIDELGDIARSAERAKVAPAELIVEHGHKGMRPEEEEVILNKYHGAKEYEPQEAEDGIPDFEERELLLA